MFKRKISPELKGFLQDWLDWSNSIDPESSPKFSTRLGLCSNTLYYNYRNYLSVKDDLSEALKDSFGDDVFPFNWNRGHYRLESKEGLCHKNYIRKAWVRKVLDRGYTIKRIKLYVTGVAAALLLLIALTTAFILGV